MCSKFRTVSAIFTDVWCIQQPQVAKCCYSNIEQRKWCRTTEIWGIGVNENVRQFFGQCEVNPRQSWMIWIPRCGSRIPSTGFWIPCFRIPADFLSWIPRIPDSTSKDLPVSGIWIPYVIPYTTLIRSEIPLPTWGEVVFHASPMYISMLSTHSLLSCN